MKILKNYSYIDMALARRDGFRDCMDILGTGGKIPSNFLELYEVLMMRRYIEEVENRIQEEGQENE
jgi:hypothetical protein|nr:MAG TPA: hypothetical protein [Caudoviricetes sp.]